MAKREKPPAAAVGYSWSIEGRKLLLVAPPHPDTEPVKADITEDQALAHRAMRAVFDPETLEVTIRRTVAEDAEERIRASLRVAVQNIAAQEGEAAALEALQSVAASELAAPDLEVR